MIGFLHDFSAQHHLRDPRRSPSDQGTFSTSMVLRTEVLLMRHYPFHIGDYRSATGHLKPFEDLALRRLIDHYYDTEKPISKDIERVSKRIGLKRSVVKCVLDEFFIEKEDGFHSSRCDRELDKYHGFIDAGIKGAEKRWKTLNKQCDDDSHPIATLYPTYSHPIETPLATVNQEPRTKGKQEYDALSHLESLSVPTEVAVDWINHRKLKKATVTKTVVLAHVREADQAKITLSEALVECCSRGWQGFKADWMLKPAKESQSNPFAESI